MKNFKIFCLTKITTKIQTSLLSQLPKKNNKVYMLNDIKKTILCMQQLIYNFTNMIRTTCTACTTPQSGGQQGDIMALTTCMADHRSHDKTVLHSMRLGLHAMRAVLWASKTYTSVDNIMSIIGTNETTFNGDRLSALHSFQMYSALI